MTQTPSLANPQIQKTPPGTLLLVPVTWNLDRTRPNLRYVYSPRTPPTS